MNTVRCGPRDTCVLTLVMSARVGLIMETLALRVQDNDFQVGMFFRGPRLSGHHSWPLVSPHPYHITGVRGPFPQIIRMSHITSNLKQTKH
jgi:hypothetical protein